MQASNFRNIFLKKMKEVVLIKAKKVLTRCSSDDKHSLFFEKIIQDTVEPVTFGFEKFACYEK